MAGKKSAAKPATKRQGSPFQLWVKPAARSRFREAAAAEHYSSTSEWARRVLLREADRILDGDAA